ncbi:MAG: thioredoxin domain-containing protein [Asgard group archaeon]|nr:thioredoxin domain-containing protein [Asgard group archaeon]
MQKPNHLINEKSPYLLQHAHNPVDWYPWKDETFEKAKKENKPIFLSIGYATCHWCHVMERESFENEQVAKILNDNFVSIKVDREERSDVDSIYMTVCQMMTGGGGWPLTIIMTPEKKPFFAGTYFPKSGQFGRPGLIDILNQVAELWENSRDEVLTSATDITTHLQKNTDNIPTSYDAEEFIARAFDIFDNRFDKVFGGFGNAPKFPSPHNLLFLLRYWKRAGDEIALNMVEKTLQKLRQGGIWDHIGYGFHRYSTDREWLVPHFEKMLYDQAMLTIAYTEAYQATKNPIYKDTAEKILKYVMRDMTSPEGGFYSAEDADSEGVEGKFYVWTQEEIKKLLDKEDADLFIKFSGISQEGNFFEEASKEKTSDNIIHTKNTLTDLAEELKLPETELESRMENIRELLFEYRKKRIHPLKDDKILTDWNGLMIVAFAKAARVLGNEDYLVSAAKASEFILSEMKNKEGKLLHRFREGDKSITANLDDYAFMIWGLLELYETTFEAKYLKESLVLSKIIMEYFWDESKGGFYFTPEYGEELLIREKTIYDGAIPSGNSVSMYVLLKLGRLTSNPTYEENANKIAEIFAQQVQKMPNAYSFLLLGLDFALGPSFEIVVVGDPDSQETTSMIEELRNQYLPNKVVLFKSTKNEKEISNIIEILKEYKTIENKPTAYVCQEFVCKNPTTDIDIMLNQLGERKKET